MKKIFLLAIILQGFGRAEAQQFVTEKKEAGAFTLASNSQTAAILFDSAEPALVKKAAEAFQHDVEMVSGKKPSLTSTIPASGSIVIVGTPGSKFIRQLVKEKKLNLARIQNKWEAYQVQLISAPFKGIGQALVIAGSDRRGVAYGIFELSRQIGVSPWYWWADVPAPKKNELYVKPTISLSDAPRVKYRGIFINDEAPALSGWSKEKFGGFNHLFYEKVFELILRLKGNYLWPAMWGNAFYDDDPLNKKTADDYGIVIGTSHHEPLMRAHDEWRRYGKGIWNYDSNELRLQQFWKEGMQRVQGTETIASIGMRGDGDQPMTQGTAIALLERIVNDQRKIIEDVTGKSASETPQLWALYKEVQDYYDKGMRVPDDVTLLLCDDNWGNIRKLPRLDEKARKGGYGIYYHFDYVGGPRNYKWINTNNIARVWEQMHLAWEYNARQIWIVNVGDIKPMEFPISFFLDYAWNPLKWNEDNLRTYYTEWASQQFGSKYAKEIGDMIRKYSQYSARRKPELLSADTYSLDEFSEWARVVDEYTSLLQQAEKINEQLAPEYRDAFFQLVLHPVKALDNLNELYYNVAKNRQLAANKSGLANEYADYAKQLYVNDSLITIQYHSIANGKWNHMMDQTHIGYTYWQQPPINKMPEVKYVQEKDGDSFTTDTTFVAQTDVLTANKGGNFFYEENGYVSIVAEHWTRAASSNNIKWKVIPDIGRDGSGISTFPVTASVKLGMNTPHVEYEFYCHDTAGVSVNLYFSPTLNFHNDEGLQFAISIDNEKPHVITLNKEDTNVRAWENWVGNNIIIRSSKHHVSKAGKHVLKYWVISPAVVLQKIVIDFGGERASYLGPPETKR